MILLISIPYIHNYSSLLKKFYAKELQRIDRDLVYLLSGNVSSNSLLYRDLPMFVAGKPYMRKIERIPESEEMNEIYTEIKEVKKGLEKLLWYTSSITSLVGKEWVHPEIREPLISMDCDERKRIIRKHCVNQQHFDFLMNTEDSIDIKIAEDLIDAT